MLKDLLIQLRNFYFPKLIRVHSLVHGMLGFVSASLGSKIASVNGLASPLLILVCMLFVYVSISTVFACSMRLLETFVTTQ